VNANTGTNFLALSGGTMTGPITLPGNAAQPLQATPLQQVVPIAGGTMTGALTLSGNAATALQATPLQQVNAVVAPAFNDVGRNLIHNGLFNIQQRGAGPFTALGYTADRWAVVLSNDANSVTTVALADADRTAIGDEAAINALQDVFTGSATAGSYSLLTQRIESVRRLGGKQVTASFWARATAGAPRIAIVVQQNFGTGGSPSGAINITLGATAALTTAWTRYTASGTVPSVAGKTLGTNNNDWTSLNIGLSDQANVWGVGIGVQSGTVQLWGVQLETGSVMTPLDYGGSPQQQLAQCQRFYQLGQIYGAGYVGGASVNCAVGNPYPVLMRAAPSLVVANDFSSGVVGARTLAGLSGTVGLNVSATSNAAGGYNLNIVWTASADL